MWIVYIIRCQDQSLYIGITTNLKKRLEKHQSGKGAKYTRGRGPFKLVYTESYPNRSQATKREYSLKNLSHSKKMYLINNAELKKTYLC